MAPKRKRGTNGTRTNKRQRKRAPTPDSDDNDHSDEGAQSDEDVQSDPYVHECTGIIEEKLIRGELKYRVTWTADPVTGRQYPPEWAEEVGEYWVNEWNQKKAAKAAKAAQEEAGKRRPSRAKPASTSPPPLRRARRQRIVESSETATDTAQEEVESNKTKRTERAQRPQAQLSRDPKPPPRKTRRRHTLESSEPSTALSAQSTPARTAHSEPSQNTSPIGSRQASPRVEIDQRNPSSLASFESHSQITESQQSLGATHFGPLPSSQSSYNGPREVRDSEADDESEEDPEDDGEKNPEGNYVPTTQNTAATSGSSQSQISSTNEEITASTLLEETQTPHSPAISIPETEPDIQPELEQDIIEDSQIEVQDSVQAQTEDLREIPDTFETSAALSQTTIPEPSEQAIRPSTQASLELEAQPLIQKPSEQDVQTSLQEPLEQEAQLSIQEPSEQDVQTSVQEPLEQEAQLSIQEPSEQAVQPFIQEPQEPPEQDDQTSAQKRREFTPPITSSYPAEHHNDEDSSGEQTTLLEVAETSQPEVQPEVFQQEQTDTPLEEQPEKHLQQQLPETPSNEHTEAQVEGQPETQVPHPPEVPLSEQREAQSAEKGEVHLEKQQTEVQSEQFPSELGFGIVPGQSQDPPGTHQPVAQRDSSPATQAREDSRVDQSTSLGDFTRASHIAIDNHVDRGDCRDPTSRNENIESHNIRSEHSPTSHAPLSEQQHAQVLSANPCLSTQQGSPDNIHSNLEQESPRSRHDSSQGSPPKTSAAPAESPSPVPQPPKQSLGTLDIDVPDRLQTPTSHSSSAIMAEDGDAALNRVRAALAAVDERKAREQTNTFTPIRRRSTKLSGTRSPSTIPDRSPMPQAPTPLRTETTLKPAPLPAEEPPAEATPLRTVPLQATVSRAASLEAAPLEAAPSEAMPSELEAAPVEAVSPAAAHSEPPVQSEGDSSSSDNNVAEIEAALDGPASSEDEHLSDVDDDDDSLLNDDLELEDQEYIVPLPIDGRQASMYRDQLKNNNKVLDAFTKSPQDADKNKVKHILHELRCIETHLDLVWNGNQTSQPDASAQSSTQHQHLALWSYDNAIKFRFVGALCDKLRERDMHVILVIEKEYNKRLFGITESFLRGKFVNFESTTGQRADPTSVEGELRVTILASTTSPITRPAHLVVCLDGNLAAAEIRKQRWAANPDLQMPQVPILQLVIPRTMGHIEYYLSPRLDAERRLHTIVATLGQFLAQGEIGQAVGYDTPKTNEAAADVVKFLFPPEDGPALAEWPLPAIGSIKEMVEYQSQPSQGAVNRTPSPPGPSVIGKRSLHDDRVEPAKKMRFTPQPQTQSECHDNNDTSHVTDSMPGTAAEVTKLQRLLEEERAQRRAEAKYHRELTESWSKQQFVHEETSRGYNILKRDKETIQKQLEDAQRREAQVREHLATRTTENAELRAKLQELQDIHISSPDELIAQNARLSKELTEKTESEQRAVRSKESNESDLNYLKERYRTQEIELAAERDAHAETRTELARVQRVASGIDQERAKLHYERGDRLDAKKLALAAAQLKFLTEKNRVLEKQKADQDKTRASRGVGGSTRAQSVGSKTPKPGSRAVSPLPVRDRLSNLRNG